MKYAVCFVAVIGGYWWWISRNAYRELERGGKSDGWYL